MKVQLRATKKWLLLLLAVLIIGLFGPFRGLNAEADAPPLSIQICRAFVEPCQNQLSISEDGTVDLDLVLSAIGPNAGSNPAQIVAWETHFLLADTAVATLDPEAASGRPVQEQGDAELALDGLLPLQSGGVEDGGQFMTVQNQFDASSGSLDYSVTLVRFDQAKPQSRVPPFSTEAPLHLGRITLKGVSKGSTDILTEDTAARPFQVVVLDSPAGLSSVTAAPLSTPQATIDVGNGATPELEGRIVPRDPFNAVPARSPIVLSITFWQSGAMPPWRGGKDLPLATFRNVVTDANGAFRITDLAPSLIPPGIYDLRVASYGALASLVQGVTIPASGDATNPPVVTAISIPSLRDGDIDGDNIIDQSDLDELKAGFGLLKSRATFNPRADFNGDGAVDVLDFALMAQNFGQKGD